MGEIGKEQMQALLGNLPFPDSYSYGPKIISGEDFDMLANLIESKRPVLHDEIASQVKELIKIRHPKQRLSDEEQQLKYEAWLTENNPATYGVYVYYPWNNRLVHIVGKEEFMELRTSRNKNKITEQEQERLQQKTVGIIGLSVGHAVAMTMATERAAGTLRIADFDNLELTNLNRIRTGVASMGLKKTTIVAREISEIDPFLKVEVFDQGINTENIDSFIHENGKLHLLIEVCDSLPIKILARLRAREQGIPVVMDTSDRGMVDVERFDLEAERPILHGKGDIRSMEQLDGLTPQERMDLLMEIVDFDSLSDKMKHSFSELGKTLTTWPQLASDVVAGGAFSTKIARRILLGEKVGSGRYYLDKTDEI